MENEHEVKQCPLNEEIVDTYSVETDMGRPIALKCKNLKKRVCYDLARILNDLTEEERKTFNELYEEVNRLYEGDYKAKCCKEMGRKYKTRFARIVYYIPMYEVMIGPNSLAQIRDFFSKHLEKNRETVKDQLEDYLKKYFPWSQTEIDNFIQELGKGVFDKDI